MEPKAANHSERVRSMFDRIARRYSLVNALVSFGRDRRWRREAVQLAEVRQGDRLLDVCCGPGELADVFAAATPRPARIVGCDFSERMLDQARLRQGRRAEPIELVHADALHLPFPDGSFDLVSCAFGVRNLADVPAGLAEFARVLAPAGRCVILEFARPAGRLFGGLYNWYFHHVLPRVGGLVSGDRGAYRYLPQSVDAFFTPGQLADMLRAAGFAAVRQRPMTMGVAVATAAWKK